jgi:CarD family transcriptional regulator
MATTVRSKGKSNGKASTGRTGARADKHGAATRSRAAVKAAPASKRAAAKTAAAAGLRRHAAASTATAKLTSKKANSVTKTAATKKPAAKTAATPVRKQAAPTRAPSKEPVKVPARPAPALRPVAARPMPGRPTLVTSAEKPVLKAPEPATSRAEPPFRKGDFVVYPTHGVGKVMGVEMHNIAGHKLQLITIRFEKDRMTLRVPVSKAQNSGLRRLSSRKVMDTALATLKGRSRIKRTMWSRRAQEYEAKINSGDPVQVAEVVRDLHRNADQPDQSYSERQIYQAALDRLVREFAAIEEIDEDQATERLNKVLKAA